MHFLSHLDRELAFEYVRLKLVPHDADWTINPTVLQALQTATRQQQSQLRAKRLSSCHALRLETAMAASLG